MVEPIRELLDAGVQSDRGERDERWERSLREQIMDARVELSSTLTEVTMSLRRVSHLEKGDIIPIDIPDLVEVHAADTPVFLAKLGVSEGNYSLKITEWIETNRHSGLHDYLQFQDQADSGK